MQSINISRSIFIIYLYALVILYAYINFNDLLMDHSEVIPILAILFVIVPKHVKVSLA